MNEIVLGNSLDPNQDQLTVEPKVFQDNCLVLGSEGCGKTTLATSIFDDLINNGSSIVAIDTRGDLTDAVARRAGIELQRGAGNPSATTDRFRVVSIDLNMAIGLFSEPKTVPEEFRNEENGILVSALLEVLGLRVRRYSPEFALLENIIDVFHDAGRGVALTELPDQIRNPPFSYIGAYALDDVISLNRREDFASALTSLLETPSLAYSSADPGLDVLGLLATPDGATRCTVLSFADRSPRIRRFLVAILGSKLRTRLAIGNNPSLLIWIDEASDFVAPTDRTLVSRLVIGALDLWERFDASFVFTAQRLSDLHEDVDNYCDTMIVGQMPEINARKDVVHALDLINPPIDENKLDEELKLLRTGQFILRSPRLDTLRRFEVRK